MQGVRTSRGCLGCQRRKKGCDLKKPSCARCQRFGTACVYEKRRWVFMNDAAGSAAGHATWGRRGENVDAAQAAAPYTGVLQRSLARTTSDLQTEAAFWTLYLPQEDPALDGSIGGVLSAPWIFTARSLAVDDRCLRTAVQACSYSGLGWMHDDNGLVQHGLSLYAHALRETNLALADPGRVLSDELLASCRMLSLFEMFRRNVKTDSQLQQQVYGWQSHVQGTFRIIQLRGHDRHRTGHGAALYDAVRMPGIIQALGHREPNLFTSLPWTFDQHTTLRDRLLRLACKVPDVLQASDSFEALIEQSSADFNQVHLQQRGRQLAQQGISLCSSLQDWESSAIRQCIEHDQNASNQPEDSVVEDPSLVQLCQSHGFGFFFACTQYWAICTVFYRTIRRLSKSIKRLPDPDGLIDSMSQELNLVDPEPHALNIAYTASVFFSPAAGLWSAQAAVFPISMAIFYFRHTGRYDSAPCKAMIAAFSANKAGTVVSDFLQGILDFQKQRNRTAGASASRLKYQG